MKERIMILLILMSLFSKAQSGIFEIYDLGVLGNDAGWDICTDSLGYTIATGSYCDGNNVCFKLFRSDLNGDELWSKVFSIYPEGLRECSRSGMIKSKNGGYLITGDQYIGDDDWQVFLMKTDDQGNQLWLNFYNSYATNFARSLHELENGDILINVDGDSSGTYRPNKSIIKTDSGGNLLWHKDYFDEFRFSEGGNMVVLSTGELLMCYRTYPWGWDYPYTTLTKLDSEGNLIWTKAYYFGFVGGSANRVVETSEGNYMLFGEKDTVDLAWVSLLINIIDTSGQVLAEKYLYLGDYDTYIYQVVNSIDGNVLVCGDYSHPNIGYDKAGWIVKLNPQGDKIWERYITNEGHMINELFAMIDIEQNPYGNIALSVLVRDMKPNGQYDLDGNAALLVLDDMGCYEPGCGEYQEIPTTLSSIKVQPVTSAPIEVYPNPASTGIHIRWQQPEAGILKLYNAYGVLTDTKPVDSPLQETMLNVSTLPAGIYLLTWESSNHAIFSQKLIITK